MAAGLVIRVLGPVCVCTGEGTEAGLRGHAARLLAWLALHPGQAWSADDLAARLWPEGSPPTFRTALQGHVSRLRRLLADAGDTVRIDTVPGGYVLRYRDDGGSTVGDGRGGESSPVDAVRFGALCDRATRERAEGNDAAAAHHLCEALALWRGEALADIRRDLPLGPAAEALDDQRRDAEDALADALVAQGDIDRALALLGRLVNDDPLREHRWALLMVALTRAGRQTDALRAYRRAAAVLVDRTGLDPGPELRRLETAILLQDPSLDAARWQPAPGSAPVPLSEVVGRDPERATVVSRLADTRLVTVVGPGGMGKTTLALDVGAAAGDTFADGVVVVDLAAGGPDDVGPAVAAAVGAPSPGEGGAEDPLARAEAVLARREVLVVLNGCEHVRTAAADAAARLLRAGPGLRVLATSQVPLGVTGEAIVTLGPLEVPPVGAGPETIRRAAAARLLAQRLDELACPVTDDAGWHDVGTITRALDGLPLALEIAAAAARSEPLGDVARRLAADTSPLLDAEPPVGAGRRRLGAALDAAVERLDPSAAELYARLSVFPVAFDAAGAAAAGGVDEATARALTAQLAEASLVVLDTDRRRARLLRPVRAHAASLLDAEGTAAAHERLTAWSLELAAELDGTLHSSAQEEVVRRFVDELPVFRMVLRRLLDGGDIGRAALLFERLVTCWGDSPASPEARIWAEDLLRHAHRLPDGPRAHLELAVVHCQYAFELIASKLDLAEQALAHGEAAGDGFAVAAAKLQVAAGLGWRSRDLDRAATLLDEARAGMQALDHHYWAAVVLELQGLLALRRLDVTTGIATLEAAAAEHRAHGARGDSAHALTFIGYARRAIGDLSGARRAFDEARLALGGVRVATWLRATVGSAHAALAMGDLAAAGETFRAAHERAVEVGDLRIVGTALVGLAAVARREGDGERSVALLAAAAGRALHGGDPTDAVTAAGMLAEMLVEQGADDEAAVVLGAAALVDEEVGVRVDFGLAQDLAPVRLAVAERLGAVRADDLAGDGRVIGLDAAIRRAGERLLNGRSPAAAPGAATGDFRRTGPGA